MTTVSTLNISRAAHSRINEVKWDQLGYGNFYTDHMFVADFEHGKWGEPAILPFGKMELSPSISAIHYGQSIFEGLKAFRGVDGKIRVYRHMDNWRRMNKSAERMDMAQMPESFFSEGLIELLRLDSAWTPKEDEHSLYIRPTLFATDEKIGVHTSSSYKFVIICCPVGKYYSKPLKTLAEKQFIRAAVGGVGFAKTAGNYAASMYPSSLARKQGYDQIIWLDAQHHEFVEEAGTMNIIAIINNTLVTPPAGFTTLAGITRDSMIQIARKWGMGVEERPLSIKEIIAEAGGGKLQELIGVGTAATVIQIATVGYEGKDHSIPVGGADSFSSKAAAFLADIRYGRVEDPFGWTAVV